MNFKNLLKCLTFASISMQAYATECDNINKYFLDTPTAVTECEVNNSGKVTFF